MMSMYSDKNIRRKKIEIFMMSTRTIQIYDINQSFFFLLVNLTLLYSRRKTIKMLLK